MHQRAPERKDAVREGLWADLRRLDERLAAAVAAAEKAFGAQAATDRFRGLHIGAADVTRLFSRAPSSPVLYPGPGAAPKGNRSSPRLRWLAQQFRLSAFDQDVLLVALAPEVDLRYERLYAYLQDDVTLRRPSVDLALNLLCASKEEKLARRSHFGCDAPLLVNGLLRLIADPLQPDPPLLAHALRLDDQVVRQLLDDPAVDRRLAGVAQFTEPDGTANEKLLPPGIAEALRSLGMRARSLHRPLRLHLHGPDAGRRRSAAEAVAAAARAPLLVVDLSLAGAEDAAALVPVAVREARFRKSVLLLEGAERLWDRDGSTQRWLKALAGHPATVILSSSAAAPPRTSVSGVEQPGFLSYPIPLPDENERSACWAVRLQEQGVRIAATDLDAVADRFLLTTDQIGAAAAVVAAADLLRTSDGASVAADLFAAARERTAWDVAGVARRITPGRRWDELVLPDDTLRQLRELCQRALHARRVLREWGFDRRLSLGRGSSALFTGPSGTGKTMAAEAIARELELDLYKVDLSGVVSKWIGETEKNLDRVFSAAEGGGGVLFFDEADALFGKRSEVHDSHDRYANVEISYLLQRMEEYEGLAILATNLRANLDEAFIRRLSFVVHFPFPDERSRLRIWERIWPETLPTDGLDLAGLARETPLTGGNIRNVALAAAYLAAADGGAVRMEHVRQAVRREFQKMGKDVAAVRAS